MDLIRTTAPIRTQVADYLRQCIADGVFAPGERLVERALCEQIGASRSTLREAFRELETEGLVEVLPGKGPAVARVDEKGIRDLFAVRNAIEQLAIQLFVRNATDESILELEAAFASLKRAHLKADARLLIREKQAFYQTLFRVADNSVIADVSQKLYSRTTRVRLVAYTRHGRIAEGLKELEKVMDALRRRDEQAACSAYAEHMANAQEAAVLALRQSSQRDTATS